VLTLQQLQGPGWWLLLPEALQSSWRREAGVGRWLFCPAASDLQPSPEQRQQAAAMEQCTLARVLFWARWLLGEPVVVRGCEVRDQHPTRLLTLGVAQASVLCMSRQLAVGIHVPRVWLLHTALLSAGSHPVGPVHHAPCHT
jgi:hypothetical protein